MGDSYNFEEIGNFMGRVAANLIDEDGDYITATHIDKKINLNVLDISANAKLTQMISAINSITPGNIYVDSTVDISGANYTLDASENKNQLNVTDINTIKYLQGISNYLQNTGLKITDSSGYTIDSIYNTSENKRQLNVTDILTQQYLQGISNYLQNTGLKITDSNGNTIDSTLNENTGQRQLDVIDLNTNTILQDGIIIKDSNGNKITGTVNLNEEIPEETKVYLDVIDENLISNINSGVKLTDTTGKIVTVTENIFPGYNGETKVYLDVIDENLISHINSGVKIADGDNNIYTSTLNDGKVYLDVIDENILAKLDVIDENILAKLDSILNLKVDARTTTKVYDNQNIIYSGNNYSSEINLSDKFVTNITIYGKFIISNSQTQLPPQSAVTTEIIVEFSSTGSDDISDWFETNHKAIITSDDSQNYFNINIVGCAAKYLRLDVKPTQGYNLTINAYIDTN